MNICDYYKFKCAKRNSYVIINGQTTPTPPEPVTVNTAYGGMSYTETGNAYTSIPRVNEPVKLRLADTMPSKNVTYMTNQIKINVAGDYLVNFNYIVYANAECTLSAAVYGTNLQTTQKLYYEPYAIINSTSGGVNGFTSWAELSGSGIVKLNAGDIVYLTVNVLDSVKMPIQLRGRQMSLSVVKVDV